MRNSLLALLLLLAPIAVHAEFLDCVFFDGFQSAGALTGSAISAADARAGLDLHNCARKTVDPAPTTPMPMLTWDSTAASTAQAWANGCTYAHGGHAGYGQNIYADAGLGTHYIPATLAGASLSWASEEPNFNYTSNTCVGGQCGHYTQMVWSTTTKVGCGQKACTTGSPFVGFPSPNWNFIVCDYAPPGNYTGQKPY